MHELLAAPAYSRIIPKVVILFLLSFQSLVMQTLTLVAALLGTVASAPSVKFPFNNQLPPVARRGETYSYTLNPDTFSSDNPMTISAPNLPSWLSFDASSWTLSGTPESSGGDETTNFTLLAADYTGTTVTDLTFEIVSAEPKPEATGSLLDVLRAAGPTADPNSLVLEPNEEFIIQFPDNFFSGDGRSIIGHYSVTKDHSPLPIWLKFDGEKRTYTGTAPSVNSDIAQAESYDVLFIESTVEGFMTVSVEFNLLVGAHSLTTNLTVDAVNTTAGEEFVYIVPINEVALNNISMTQANVSSVTVDGMPNWLEFDGSYNISGVPSSSDANQTYNMTVTVSDTYNDTVNWQLSVNVQEMVNTTVFKSSTIGPINATQGEYFSYSFADALVKQTEISIDTDQDWISYVDSNYTIHGEVPSSFNGTTITLTASEPNNNQKRHLFKRDLTAKLSLMGISRNLVTTSSSASPTSSSPSATASSSSSTSHRATATTAAAAAAPSKKSNLGLILGCALGIPLGLLLVALILLFFICRRRRKRANKTDLVSSQDHDKLSTGLVSAPVDVKGGPSPVFKGAEKRTTSSVYSDGNTMVETPEVDKEDPKDWSTPQRVSAYNFLQMDNSTPELAGGAKMPTHIHGDHPSSNVAKAAALSVPVAVSGLSNATPAPGGNPVADHALDSYQNVPRQSWRHTNITNRRWQDVRCSYNSLASVGADQAPEILPSNQDYPAGALPRDESSGIVHIIDPGLSSREHSNQVLATHDEDASSLSSNYRTASSGDESEHSSDEGSHNPVRAYRDDQGDFQFEEHGDTPTAKLRQSASIVGRAQQHVSHHHTDSQAGELAFV